MANAGGMPVGSRASFAQCGLSRMADLVTKCGYADPNRMTDGGSRYKGQFSILTWASANAIIGHVLSNAKSGGILHA